GEKVGADHAAGVEVVPLIPPVVGLLEAALRVDHGDQGAAHLDGIVGNASRLQRICHAPSPFSLCSLLSSIVDRQRCTQGRETPAQDATAFASWSPSNGPASTLATTVGPGGDNNVSSVRVRPRTRPDSRRPSGEASKTARGETSSGSWMVALNPDTCSSVSPM